jgi:hypothetical protein
MSALDRNPHWAMMARRLPGGLTVIGPDLLRIIACGLQDGRALRTDQGSCEACPTEADIVGLDSIGIDIPEKCSEHQLDDDTDAMYKLAQVLLRVEPPDHRALEDALRNAEEGGR